MGDRGGIDSSGGVMWPQWLWWFVGPSRSRRLVRIARIRLLDPYLRPRLAATLPACACARGAIAPSPSSTTTIV